MWSASAMPPPVLTYHGPDGTTPAAFQSASSLMFVPESSPRETNAAAARAAFATIARAAAAFVSRGDDSGTNIKELALWKAAGVVPSGPWYVKTGGGMADALHIASQKAAYTLSDDGTY